MFTFKVEGFKELEDALRKLPEEVAGKVLRAALRKAALPMVEAARQAAPRSDSPGPRGHMADSINVRLLKGVEGDHDIETHLAIGPDSNHFYGLFQEFGTVHQPARPFLRPAFDNGAEGALKQFSAELGKGIERAARKLAKS